MFKIIICSFYFECFISVDIPYRIWLACLLVRIQVVQQLCLAYLSNINRNVMDTYTWRTSKMDENRWNENCGGNSEGCKIKARSLELVFGAQSNLPAFNFLHSLLMFIPCSFSIIDMTIVTSFIFEIKWCGKENNWNNIWKKVLNLIAPQLMITKHDFVADKLWWWFLGESRKSSIWTLTIYRYRISVLTKKAFQR